MHRLSEYLNFSREKAWVGWLGCVFFAKKLRLDGWGAYFSRKSWGAYFFDKKLRLDSWGAYLSRKSLGWPRPLRKAQESPGKPRRAHGKPRRAQGKLRRAQESAGEPRRAQGAYVSRKAWTPMAGGVSLQKKAGRRWLGACFSRKRLDATGWGCISPEKG